MSLRELLSQQPVLSLTNPRRTTFELHFYLRDLIVRGVFPVGTELKQAELARIFPVSRTPLREALRMLQEEGLVAGEPNQRCRVVGHNAEELDSLYAVRITLESLGIRLTAGFLDDEERRSAGEALRELERTTDSDDIPAWSAAHQRFHRLMVARAGEPVLRTIASYAEMSERYVRTQHAMHGLPRLERQAEHVAIFDAVTGGATSDAVRLLAGHLANAATHIIDHAEPGRGAPAVEAAVRLVSGTEFERAGHS